MIGPCPKFEKTERNQKILSEYLLGTRKSILSEKYGISPAAVDFHVKKQAKRMLYVVSSLIKK